jgi:hypothetical protein
MNIHILYVGGGVNPIKLLFSSVNQFGSNYLGIAGYAEDDFQLHSLSESD